MQSGIPPMRSGRLASVLAMLLYTARFSNPVDTIVPVSKGLPKYGLKRLDERRFRVRYTDFVPDKDLSVLFIHAYERF